MARWSRRPLTRRWSSLRLGAASRELETELAVSRKVNEIFLDQDLSPRDLGAPLAPPRRGRQIAAHPRLTRPAACSNLTPSLTRKCGATSRQSVQGARTGSASNQDLLAEP